MMKNRDGQRGAILVEATLALPFFMFAIYTILTIIQISYTQARVAVALDSATKQLSEYVHVYFAVGLDEKITGEGGKSSELANSVAEFLQDLGGVLGNVSDELGRIANDENLKYLLQK